MDKSWGLPKEKTYLKVNFHLWSCDLKKDADSPFWLKKSLSWKPYELEQKRQHFGITKGKN